MSPTAINPNDDSPFDEESLGLLSLLPKRNSIISLILALSKIVGFLIFGFGGIGLILEIKEASGPAGEQMIDQHFGAWLLRFLLACSLMGVGGLLWFIHDHFVFDKAPLGSLLETLFEMFGPNGGDKVQRICRAIIKQTDSKDMSSLPILLSRAISFQVSAETASDEEQGVSMAKKAIPLYQKALEKGLKTPLVYFGLATSARIQGQNELAVDYYNQYLSMRPGDTQTKEIMEQCALIRDGVSELRESTWESHKSEPQTDVDTLSEEGRTEDLDATDETLAVPIKDTIRWFHIVAIIFAPWLTVAWGVLKLMRRETWFGFLLILFSAISFGAYIVMFTCLVSGH